MDRPILFSGPMVRALREGRKTQTRRLVGRFDVFRLDDGSEAPVSCLHVKGDALPRITVGNVILENPLKAAVGDRLWVREAHYLTDDGDYQRVVCAVDDDKVRGHLATVERLKATHPQIDWGRHARLRPGIHMPRWASRLTLTVTDVRVQRLQDISEEDARAEGAEAIDLQHSPFLSNAHRIDMAGTKSHTLGFWRIWTDINGCGSWDENPWVAAYSFTVEHRNIVIRSAWLSTTRPKRTSKPIPRPSEAGMRPRRPPHAHPARARPPPRPITPFSG